MDRINRTFRERQLEQGLSLASQSDILELSPLETSQAPSAYRASFRCKTLVCQGTEVEETDFTEVGIVFPPHYLEHVDPLRVVSVLFPFHLFHPNVMGPVVCVGRLNPGTELTDILYQVYEILTFQKKTTNDFLNPAAAQWCRNHLDELPLQRCPLKRVGAVALPQGEGSTPDVPGEEECAR